jgi:predicted RNase H-like nuclease (RuvC/YqgF family)
MEKFTMNRVITCLIGAAALVGTVPAFAHGSRAGDGPQPSNYASNHETHELQEKINGLNKDIEKDNRKLTEDEQKLIGLEIRAAEFKAGKAPPLSADQLRELAELRNRIGNLNKDIGQDSKRLSADETKLKAWEDRPAP